MCVHVYKYICIYAYVCIYISTPCLNQKQTNKKNPKQNWGWREWACKMIQGSGFQLWPEFDLRVPQSRENQLPQIVLWPPRIHASMRILFLSYTLNKCNKTLVYGLYLICSRDFFWLLWRQQLLPPPIDYDWQSRAGSNQGFKPGTWGGQALLLGTLNL